MFLSKNNPTGGKFTKSCRSDAQKHLKSAGKPAGKGGRGSKPERHHPPEAETNRNGKAPSAPPPPHIPAKPGHPGKSPAMPDKIRLFATKNPVAREASQPAPSVFVFTPNAFVPAPSVFRDRARCDRHAHAPHGNTRAANLRGNSRATNGKRAQKRFAIPFLPHIRDSKAKTGRS